MFDSNIAINTTTCLACGNCVDRCIMDNLRVALPPGRQTSPLGVNYQGIMRLVAAGRDEEAARELRRRTAFGGLLAAWGDEKAERSCSRGHRGGSLAMGSVLKWLASTQSAVVYSAPEVRHPSGKTAAVIGSGPAGLQAAMHIRERGHAVTIFEAAGRLSPALAEPSRGGDPIPQDVLEKTAAMIEAAGITVVTGIKADASALSAEFDAVIVCTGSGAEYEAGGYGHVSGNLFAAGSCVKGSAVRGGLQAMASALPAARAVCSFLEGFELDYEQDVRTANGLERFQGLPESAEDLPDAPRIDTDGSDEAAVRAEAARCLGCGRPVERDMTCWYCLPCEVVCPVQAIRVRIPYLIR
ncbi:MAG: NAD(P)-binding protein [Mailhella sp.]|nr:NAD(P)-binding protein [Mailhella sp.]